MSDGIATGWDQATWLLGWLLGAVGPLLAVAACIVLGYLAAAWADHRTRVTRVKRQARRSGRAT